MDVTADDFVPGGLMILSLWARPKVGNKQLLDDYIQAQRKGGIKPGAFKKAQKKKYLAQLDETGFAFDRFAKKELEVAFGEKLEALKKWVKRFGGGIETERFAFHEVQHLLPSEIDEKRYDSASGEYKSVKIPITDLAERWPNGQNAVLEELGENVQSVADQVKALVKVLTWNEDAKERYDWARKNRALGDDLRQRGYGSIADLLANKTPLKMRWIHEYEVSATLCDDAPGPVVLVGDMGASLHCERRRYWGAPDIIDPESSERQIRILRSGGVRVWGDVCLDPTSVPRLTSLNPYCWIEYSVSEDSVVHLHRVFLGGHMKRSKPEMWRPEDAESPV